MENATPQDPPQRPPKRRTPRGWGVLLFLLVGLAVLAASLVVPRDPTPVAPRGVTFPLPGRYETSFTDDWGEARMQGAHEGTDVFAPQGTPIRSITGGTVVRARGSNADGWNTLGGYTVMVEAAYDAGPVRRGDLLYYAHMRARSDLRPGEVVGSGEKIGEVGDTGQGPEGTRGRFEPHLHLGLYEGGWPNDGRTAAPSGAMNPYPLLRWLAEDTEK